MVVVDVLDEVLDVVSDVLLSSPLSSPPPHAVSVSAIAAAAIPVVTEKRRKIKRSVMGPISVSVSGTSWQTGCTHSRPRSIAAFARARQGLGRRPQVDGVL
jgi:hypothetical protein